MERQHSKAQAPAEGKTRPQPEPEREESKGKGKGAAKPDDGPLDVEGGRRSDVNGKFEADHRPSR